MKVTKEQLEKSQTKVHVEMTQDELMKYQEKAAKRLAEQMNIPGFRKGQAPFDVVVKKAGEMAVLQQAAELAVQSELPKIVEQEGLETVGQPQIEIEKLAPENPFTFNAIFPLMPEVTVGDLKKVKVEKESVDVTEEEVTKVIDNVRKMRAKDKAVDRAVKEGDKVVLDFSVFLDSIPVDGGTGKEYPLTVGENTMIPGFEDNVVGMKAGEEKEFKLKFPDEYHNEQLKGKECDFKVKLHSVNEVELPELNDEFAKEVSPEFETVDALKDAIEKNLHEEKSAKVDAQYEQAMLEAALEQSKFGDIPEVMTKNETQVMLQELEQNIGKQGLPMDQYLQQIKKSREELMLEFMPDAIKRIKSGLLIRAVAKQENIEPTEDEIKAEIDSMMHAYQGNEEILKHIQSPQYMDYLKNVARNKKTIHWMKEQIQS